MTCNKCVLMNCNKYVCMTCMHENPHAHTHVSVIFTHARECESETCHRRGRDETLIRQRDETLIRHSSRRIALLSCG